MYQPDRRQEINTPATSQQGLYNTNNGWLRKGAKLYYNFQIKKSRIRETPNLSTDADSSTDTCFPPAAVCHVSHVTCHMGKFFCNFRNICTIKSFLMKQFKRRDDPKLHSYIGFCWLLTTTKNMNQQYQNHKFFATFRFQVHPEFFSTSFFISCKIGIFSESKAGCIVVLTDNTKYTMQLVFTMRQVDLITF